jgi:hypothetical protein
VRTSRVLAAYAFAVLATSQAQIETLAVFFLTMALPAVASFLPSSLRTLLNFKDLLCARDGVLVVLAVEAPRAVAVVSAHLSRGETFAIHFEAFCLLAGAASFFPLYGDSRTNSVLADVLLERDVVVLGILLRQLGKVPDTGVVFLSLDEDQ